MLASIPYPEIDPVFFSIGPLPIRWYALAYIAGILIGWFYLTRLMQRPQLWQGKLHGAAPAGPPLSREQFDDLLFWVTLGIILGGRLGFVLFYEPSLLIEPWDPIPPALKIWTGGMSFHGGLIGVTLAGFFFARKHSLDPLRVGDMFACAAPIGLFFGRIANFINAELFGRPTDGPMGMVFPNRYDHGTDQWIYALDAVPRHPSQLYEAALEGLLLFIILAIATHTFRIFSKPGLAIGIFLAGYGAARTFVENFREPDAHMPEFPLGLTMGMILSLPMVILGAYIIWRANGGFKPEPTPSKTTNNSPATKNLTEGTPLPPSEAPVPPTNKDNV